MGEVTGASVSVLIGVWKKSGDSAPLAGLEGGGGDLTSLSLFISSSSSR